MIITESPTDVDEQFLYAQLNQYNDQYRTKDGKLISIYIKDANGKIVAGLSGLTFLTWLQVDVLWVNEMERGKNIGSELLAKAECIAIDRDCIGVNIETYSYQAYDFYLKQGYTEFGRLTGYGPHTRHFLKKMFTKDI